MILPLSLALVYIFLGYLVVVACSLGATLGLTSAAPHFVETDHCLSGKYKLSNALVWLVCTALGGFVTARVGDRGFAWPEAVGLAGALIAVLWANTWEARQRGLPHQILLTVLTIIGVAVGFRMRY